VTPALASAPAQSPLAQRLDSASAAKQRAFLRSSLCRGTTAADLAAAVPEKLLLRGALAAGVSEERSAASAAMTGLLERAAPLVSVPSASTALCSAVCHERVACVACQQGTKVSD
jgi:hypothetical protein